MNKQLLVYSFLLSAVLMVVIYLAFGIYWEETMAWYAWAIYGQTASPPYEAWIADSTGQFMLHLPVFSYLSGWFPHLPVLGIWVFILQILWTGAWIYLFLDILSCVVPPLWLRSVCAVLLIVCICSTSLVYIYPSRISILLVSGSTIAFCRQYQTAGRRSLFFIILFLAGTFVRVFMSVFALIIVTTLVLADRRSLGATIRVLWLHWLTVVGLLATLMVYELTAPNKALITEEYYETTLVKKSAIVPISQMKTESDSIRYTALISFFCVTDTAQMNTGFFKKVIDRSKSIGGFIKKESLEKGWRQILSVLHDYVWQLVSGGVAVMLLFAIAFRSTSIALLPLVLGWIMIFALGMRTMNDRFLLPWLSMLALIGIYFSFYKNMHVRVVWRWLLLSVIMAGCYPAYTYMRSTSLEEASNNVAAKATLSKIASLSRHHTPIIWDSKAKYGLSDILARNEMDALGQCVFQVMPQFSFYRFGQLPAEIKLGFSPLDWRSMGLAILQNRERVHIVADRQFAQFLPIYFKKIYSIDLKVTQETSVGEFAPDVFAYRVETP